MLENINERPLLHVIPLKNCTAENLIEYNKKASEEM